RAWRRYRDLWPAARFQRAPCFLGRRRSCYWSGQRRVRQCLGKGAFDPTCASYAGRMADDFRRCSIVSSWVCRRWKPGALSLECDVDLLSVVSGDHWLGAHVSASLLAPAATDCSAVAKHFAYHSTRRGDARLVV